MRHEPRHPVRALQDRTREELRDPGLVYASTDMRAWVDCEERALLLGLPLGFCDGLCYCPGLVSERRWLGRMVELGEAA